MTVRRRPIRAAIAAALSIALAGGAALVAAHPAMATFADSGTATSGTFAAYTVPAPVVTSCVVTGNSLFGFNARISWTAVSSPHALTYTARIVNTGTVLTVQSSGTTRYVDVQSGLLGSLLGHAVTIEMLGRPPGPGTWTSVPAQQQVMVALLGLNMTCL